MLGIGNVLKKKIENDFLLFLKGMLSSSLHLVVFDLSFFYKRPNDKREDDKNIPFIEEERNPDRISLFSFIKMAGERPSKTSTTC